MGYIEEPRKLVSKDLIVEEIPHSLSGVVFLLLLVGLLKVSLI